MSLECPQESGTEEAEHACGQIKSPNVQNPINKRLIYFFNHSVLQLVLGNMCVCVGGLLRHCLACVALEQGM